MSTSLIGAIGYDPLGTQPIAATTAPDEAELSSALLLLSSTLPPNATAFERRLETSTWRLDDSGPVGIRALWNAKTVPAAMLPWIAWALNVDAWDTAWDEAKKRSVIGTALATHAADGTLQAVRAITELCGGTVTNVIRPPCQLYYGAAPTQAEKDAALAVFPQLLLRANNDPFVVPDGTAFGGRFPGRCYGVDLGDAERVLPRAFVQDKGSTTECAVVQTVAADGQRYLEIRVPLTNSHGTYDGGFPQFGPVVDAPVYILATTQAYAGPGLGVNYKLASAGIEPTQVFPDWISESYSAQGIFPVRNFASSSLYWQASGAADHVHARLYLFDGSRTLEATGKSFFLDAVHTGVQPYTAQIRAWFPLQRSPFRASYYGQGFFVGEDYAWLTRYLASLARCTALRDTVLVDTRNYAVVLCGTQTRCDSATVCGAMVPRE
jgi:phage tail P2-like protein